MEVMVSLSPITKQSAVAVGGVGIDGSYSLVSEVGTPAPVPGMTWPHQAFADLSAQLKPLNHGMDSLGVRYPGSEK